MNFELSLKNNAFMDKFENKNHLFIFMPPKPFLLLFSICVLILFIIACSPPRSGITPSDIERINAADTKCSTFCSDSGGNYHDTAPSHNAILCRCYNLTDENYPYNDTIKGEDISSALFKETWWDLETLEPLQTIENSESG